jgi:hypothetical protein
MHIRHREAAEIDDLAHPLEHRAGRQRQHRRIVA